MPEYQRESAFRWNLMLLAGRPLALLGVAFVAWGISTGNQSALALGCAAIIGGFVSAWTGKLAKFWFHD